MTVKALFFMGLDLRLYCSRLNLMDFPFQKGILPFELLDFKPEKLNVIQ